MAQHADNQTLRLGGGGQLLHNEALIRGCVRVWAQRDVKQPLDSLTPERRTLLVFVLFNFFEFLPKDIIAFLGYGSSTVYRDIKSGEFFYGRKKSFATDADNLRARILYIANHNPQYIKRY